MKHLHLTEDEIYVYLDLPNEDRLCELGVFIEERPGFMAGPGGLFDVWVCGGEQPKGKYIYVCVDDDSKENFLRCVRSLYQTLFDCIPQEVRYEPLTPVYKL